MLQEKFVIEIQDHMLQGCIWHPDAEAEGQKGEADTAGLSGIILLIHGMAEHIRRYAGFAEFLTAHGYLLAGIDLPGHGASAVSNQELGHFADKDGWRYVVNSLCRVRAMLLRRYAGLPLVLMGHSMGSLYARYLAAYCRNAAEPAAGYIFCGTPGPNAMLPAGLLLARLQRRIKGRRWHSKSIDRFMNGPFNRQFRPVQTEADWLSRDPEAVNAYLADPKCGFVFTASAYYDLFSVMKRVQTAKWGRALDPELPYLVISGTEDPVGGNGKGVEKVVRRMRRGGAADVTLHLYEGARHELLNETNREEIMQDILQWLQRVVSESPKK